MSPLPHLPNLIEDLALILAAAGFVTLLFGRLKQPLVLGYILAGMLIGPHITLFPSVSDLASIKIWAEIGMIFLLFSLGLEFSFKKLVRVGGSASITAIVEMSILFLLSYNIARLTGWSKTNSLFLGAMLSISSTTIIIRAFRELGVSNQRFASIVYGVLIMEDLVAVLLLVALSTLGISDQLQGSTLAFAAAKLFFFLMVWFLGGIFLIPTLLKKTKNFMTDETMLVVSIAFCLIMVVAAARVGFSPSLGAFIMGSILAETTYAEKIEHLTTPVKNLFAAVFFVSVGMLIEPHLIWTHLPKVALFCGVVLFGKTLGVTLGALISGQTLKHSMQAAMSLAQIGEFSFIIASLGVALNVTDPSLYPIVVAVSVITTFTTPYFIKLAEPFYQVVSKRIPRSWNEKLIRYSSNTQSLSSESDWKKVSRAYVTRIAIHSVIMIAIFLLTQTFLHPFVFSQIQHDTWSKAVVIFIALVCSAPFLWAMAIGRSEESSFTQSLDRIRSNRKLRGPILLLEGARILFALGFICFFLFKFTSSKSAVFIPLAGLTLFFLAFSRRVQVLSNWFEARFLGNLNERDKKASREMLPVLAPWDAHIATFEVHPNSTGIGKTLLELAIREKFGVTVALIERGGHRITAPSRDERFFPFDKVSVIGTDDQLAKFSPLVTHAKEDPKFKGSEEFSLETLILAEGSPFLEHTIRDSGLREKTDGLVVGLERAGKRVLNPDSKMKFELGDRVWIVGDKLKIRKL